MLLFANVLATLNATPPGTPMFVITSLIFPAVVASAYSSKGFIFLQTTSSTFAAVLVSAPRSIKFAPKETNPSGILNKPEPIPAKKDPIVLTSTSFPSAQSFCFSVFVLVQETNRQLVAYN